MELKDYQWPELSALDIAFSTTKAPKELVEEAEKRDLSKGEKKFNELFFSGGRIQRQADVDGTWKEKALAFAISLMKSWEPKHEHKAAICAMIFEETLVL